MGPRAFAHGDSASIASGSLSVPGFNGAAGFRPRRRPGSPCQFTETGNASMGPRAFAHGDCILVTKSFSAIETDICKRFLHGTRILMALNMFCSQVLEQQLTSAST